MKSVIHQTRPKRLFYAKDVNIAYSFDSLYEIAKEMLGAELEVGDIIVVDNRNRTKRKMMQMTKTGYLIFYGKLHKNGTFNRIQDHSGMVKNLPSGALI